MATKDSNALEISVSVKLENADRADKLPAVAAYAFSSEGRLLSATALDGKDGAVLRLPPVTTVQPLGANLRAVPADHRPERQEPLGRIHGDWRPRLESHLRRIAESGRQRHRGESRPD